MSDDLKEAVERVLCRNDDSQCAQCALIRRVLSQATRPEARRVVGRYDDSNRLEWVCERLSEHSMYLQHYKHAHELPRGGFALYTNSTLLGYGECIADAIDDAIKKSEATPSPQLIPTKEKS